MESAPPPADLVNCQLAQPAVGQVPGEYLQSAVNHGQHLLDFPFLSIAVNFSELV